MLIFQRKIKYHPSKELNKQQTNAEQTIKTNQQTNKQNRTNKTNKNIPSANLFLVRTVRFWNNIQRDRQQQPSSLMLNTQWVVF
jgi:hypothetical protein